MTDINQDIITVVWSDNFRMYREFLLSGSGIVSTMAPAQALECNTAECQNLSGTDRIGAID